MKTNGTYIQCFFNYFEQCISAIHVFFFFLL